MAVSQTKTYLLSIIIVNYKTDELTAQLVAILGKDKDTEIIVVDNSPQNFLEKKLPSYVKYFLTGKNLGFAGGNNFGIKKASGEWVFLLNSDTMTGLPKIKRLLRYVQDRNYKVGAPKLIGKNKIAQDTVGYFDTFSTNPVNYLFARPRFISCEKMQKPRKVDVATGAALLIHSSVFEEVGFLDERFFMYFEDIDFCYELSRKGYKILFVPEISIIHYGGSSADLDMQKKQEDYRESLNYYLKKRRGSIVTGLNSLVGFLR